MWAQTTSQVSDLPMENGLRIVNPWNFVHHMSLYRLMIDATAPYMQVLWSNATDNPMWGQPLQLGWFFTSGRLADPTGASTCGLQADPACVSAQSWWACVNYFGIALSFMSAAQQGLFGESVQVQMQVPEGEGDYCTTYADCAARYPDAVAKWDAFFQALKSVNESLLPENEEKDALLGFYWEAQTASNHASSVCNSRRSHYSSAEQTFTEAWLNSAQYVSACRYHSTLEKASLFLAPMPSRILREDDSAPNISDLTLEENRMLNTFNWLNSINNFFGGRLLSMWNRSMCSVATRENGRQMLEQLLLNPSFAASSFLTIVNRMREC
ncbi:protein LEG1 homolog [Brachionichthys hirsutus]|uniref:protein LEG1 homolog n=1 Tax=Brachionichthys hirsutus TaxID=412623 RepID=UPI0036043D42